MFRPSFLCLLALGAAVASPDPATAAAAATDANDDDDKRVKIELYYESQCPGCRETITHSFKEAYAAPGFLKMADVTLVPFGNAREESSTDGGGPPYTFQCQHGPSECNYNAVEACALSKIKCPYTSFQFVNCVENYDEDRTPDQDYDAVLTSCATLTGNGDVANDISTCFTGPEGNALVHELAQKTGALSPQHEYVPWIVADGKHDDTLQNKIMANLLKYVCEEYDGPDKSPGCPRTATPTLRVEPKHAPRADVCYRSEDENAIQLE